ncbi:MAG: hypothetical protein FJY99_12035 [Candidatus Sericytochromatia bacterium]|nr:hypothetical protein [Candidatus Tanganyikabacteria bacterium]
MPKPIGPQSPAAPALPSTTAAGAWPEVLNRVRATLAVAPAKVPTDAESRKAWVTRESAVLTAVDKDMEVLREAWFDKHVDFETYTGLSSLVFDRHVALDRVRAAGASSALPGKPAVGKEACPGYMAPDLMRFIERNQANGLGLIGAVVLPAAALVDLSTALGKLAAVCDKKTAKPR